MLTAITLDGFRCFAELTRVTFGSLTILAGANRAGKSSVIHAFLALVQSQKQHPIAGRVRLCGEWVEIGSFQQALNYSRQSDRRIFTLGITGRVGTIETDALLTLSDGGESSKNTAKIEKLETYISEEGHGYEGLIEPNSAGEPYYRFLSRNDQSSEWKETGLLFGGFPWNHAVRGENGQARSMLPYEPESILYLSAFRDLPRTFYPQRRSDIGPLLGTMGEHVAETLFLLRNTTADVLPKDRPSMLLGAALQSWWSHIFGGHYSIRAEAAGEAPGFTLSLDTPSAESLNLTQVGTGLSQALPVVVLGLCSKPGDLVIVESPEVQLHPAAQHRLMDFFVALARGGRQVILETHSDHIIHAAQLAVKNKHLTPDEVGMRFFSQEDGVARVEEVPIDEHGRMQKQPLGFVDQATTDLLELIR